MPGKLFLAPFGFQGATRLLFQEALRDWPGNDYRRLVYIAPTPRKVRAAQLEFMQEVGQPACIAPTFATLGQFVHDAYRDQGTARPLAPELRIVLLMRLMRQATRREAKPGHARAIADFTALIRQYRPDLQAEPLSRKLSELLVGFESTRTEALAAVQLMKRYRAVLAEKGWIDDEGIYEHLACRPSAPPEDPIPSPKSDVKMVHGQDARATFSRPLVPKGTTLILDGFYDLTRLQERLVARLLDEAKSVFALACWDPKHPGDYELVGSFHRFVRSRRPELAGVQLESTRPVRSQPEFLEYASRVEEVEAIARDLKLRLLKGELRSSEAIVVFPKFAPYAPIVNRVFAKFEIPFTIYPDVNLSASAIIVSVVQLLDAVANDYPRVSFVSALTSPFFPRISETCRSRVNRYSIQVGLIKGAGNWRHIRQRLRDRGLVEEDSVEDERVAVMQKEIDLVLGLCGEFAAPRNTLSGYARALKTLLAELELGRGLGPETAGEAARRESLTHRRMLYQLLDALVAFEADFGQERFSRVGEFGRLLEYLVGLMPVPPEREPNGVLVCSTLESHGLDCKRLYYGGLIEGELPTRFKHDPILPDWVRARLALPDVERHSRWQQLHFFRLVNTPHEAPFLSFPDTAEDTILLPSPFLEGDPKLPEGIPGVFTSEEQQRRIGRQDKTGFEDRVLRFELDQDREVLAELSRRFAPDQAISVTRLEGYRQCPFRFYIETVLKLEPYGEPDYELEARQWGTIFHKVLELLFRRGKVEVDQIPERIRPILARVMREEGLPAFWQQAITRVFEATLPGYLDVERELRAGDFGPETVERSLTGRISENLTVKGRLDRVDRGYSPRGSAGFHILDYKTGKQTINVNSVLKHGTHLQLPIYARLLQNRYPKTPVLNVGIVDLRKGKVTWLAAGMGTPPVFGAKTGSVPLEELVSAAIANACASMNQIRAARFAEAPLGTCYQCRYHYFCPARLAVAAPQMGTEEGTADERG
jgi:RecB family exonuclease